ncbi:MAG: carbohydrate-binding domain-containing protein [Bacteroidaceae bacterium]|nr:carbohydrate-binding domain-containing protein [Bacteroidaceae bacterium]
MKKILVWALPFLMGSVCQAEDITIRYNGSTAKVDQKAKDSVTVTVNGANVNVDSKYTSHKLTVLLTGKSDDGQLVLKTTGKAKITLNKLNLTSQEGAPIDLKNKKKVEIAVANGTENTLTITACNDTANHKAATIWAKDKLLLSGKGTLNIIATGDGCRGIKTKDDITIEDLTLNVTTSGNHLGEKPFSFGDFGGFGGGEMPDFSNFQMPEGGFPDFGGFGGFPGFGGEANDSTRQGGFGGFPGFGGGGFPGFGGMRPEGNDSTRQGGFGGGFPNFGGGGFPNFGEGGMPNFGGFGGGFGGFGNPDEEGEEDEEGGGMGFGGKRKYVASTKGIASKGKITINSGNITVKTSTAGAEGIEGKEGVIINGGMVDVMSPDDAINANATIEFNGGTIIARSKGNDAVDSNPKGGFFMPFGGNNNNQEDTDPAIIITGGTVYAWSQAGSPEEGLDCDFAPLVIEGGTIFTVGGGMGEMPSVPTNYTSKQPSALLIGINIVKEEPVYLYDGNNKLLETITVPFSLRRSASLVSSAAFQVGETYTVKTKGYEKTFTLSENFTAVR